MNQSNNLSKELRQKISNFLNRWHSDFILDYWWRKKHNVPFGSPEHRAMNFIDMLIEYQEDEEVRRARERAIMEEYEDTGGMKISQEEIDSDYDNLDLKLFNK